MDKSQDRLRISVRRDRKVVKVSQFQLADASGVGRTRIALWETGNMDLRPVEISELRRALRRLALQQSEALLTLATEKNEDGVEVGAETAEVQIGVRLRHVGAEGPGA